MSPRDFSENFHLNRAKNKGLITAEPSESFAFFVPMAPTAKERVRVVRSGQKTESVGGVTGYTPKKTRDAEARIAMEWLVSCRKRIPSGRQIRVEITAFYDRPKTHLTKAGGVRAEMQGALPGPRHDWDNLAKLVCDALNGLAFDDDRFIVDGHVRKAWTDPTTSVRRNPANSEGFLIGVRTVPSSSEDLAELETPKSVELLHEKI